ncbi:universal stress protein [Phormidium sp. FACHB-1136]|uniref:universal stress protein n=1 Tax=Phormidium sp. FACHB-1136 TaxID=2692848 RepID=UPI001686B270|nr:universal stress protein [Phormidium sp. FACHB-1136]MBD2426459.1 universal stress protein [Phormidium sp. FACHB-1136]
MGQYQRILAAIDQSALSEQVFATALGLAKSQGAHLHLAHCFTLPLPTNLDFGDRYRASAKEFLAIAQEQMDATLEHTRQWLDTLEAQAQEAGIEVSWDWRGGEVGPQICDIAKQYEADLIVIGRRGRGRLQTALLGSVSNYVLHHAHCSVLVVQHSNDKKNPQP